SSITRRRARRSALVPYTTLFRSSLQPMAIQPIRIFGDPVLRATAKPVTTFDKELRRLVKDLTDTMLEAPGAGLAAPQLGVSMRVDRKSTRLNSSHGSSSYAVFCL